MTPLIISYYTLNTPYYQVMHDYLIPSIQRFNLESDIRGIESKGCWYSNTLYKAVFVFQMLQKHKRDVLFLDADAEILEYPDIFETIPDNYKFAFHLLNKSEWYKAVFQENFELLSGTGYFRYSNDTLEIVQEWIDRCSQHSKVWEQKVLQEVLKPHIDIVYQLPVEYAWIRTLPDGREPHVIPAGPIVIRHNQVSRKLKNIL